MSTVNGKRYVGGFLQKRSPWGRDFPGPYARHFRLAGNPGGGLTRLLDMATFRRLLRHLLPLPLCIFLSLVVGVFGGTLLSLELGASPDLCGGTIYIVCGAILTGLLSIPSGLLTKSRDVFYGFNTFTFLVFLWLLISIIKALAIG